MLVACSKETDETQKPERLTSITTTQSQFMAFNDVESALGTIEGIIDPTKVTRCALENAASAAGTLLTTECVIADEEEEAPMPPMGGGMPGGMGGMGGMGGF